MKIAEVIVAETALKQMKSAAIEIYPQESTAELIGRAKGPTAVVTAIHTYQKPVKRTRNTVQVADEDYFRVLDIFDDEIIGYWHSHPEQYPSASDADKEALIEDYCDGAIMVICGIWPSKRKGWAFRWKSYASHVGRVHRTGMRIGAMRSGL